MQFRFTAPYNIKIAPQKLEKLQRNTMRDVLIAMQKIMTNETPYLVYYTAETHAYSREISAYTVTLTISKEKEDF